MISHVRINVAVIALLGVCGFHQSRAAVDSPADLLPGTTVVYVEAQRPADLLALVFDSPLRSRIESLPEVKQQLDSPQMRQLNQLVTHLETQMGMKWRPALQTITDGGLTLAIDPATKAGTLIAKSSKPHVQRRFVQTMLEVVRNIAADQGQPDPISVGQYRGIKTYQIDKGYVALLDGGWLVAVSEAELGQAIVDNFLDGGEFTLAREREFTAARQGRGGDQLSVWGFLGVRTLRTLGIGREFYARRQSNPGAEFLLGGLLATLRGAPYATMEMTTSADSLEAAVVLPHDPLKVPVARRFFFAPVNSEGAAAKPLTPRNAIASVTTYRDIGAMWMAGPELFGEDANARMAKTDRDLSNFFGGRSFSADVLGSMKPQFQLIVAQQQYGKGEPVPQLKLPAGALVFRMNQPEQMRQSFTVMFQGLVAFGNINAANQGRPMLMVQPQQDGDAMVWSSAYLKPQGQPMDGSHLIYNFSPTLAMRGDWFILSTTSGLGKELIDLTRKPQADQKIKQNTLIQLDPQALAKLTEQNREYLVADNMVKKGITQEASAKEIGGLIELMSWAKRATAELKVDHDRKQLRLEADLKIAKP